MKTYYVSPKGNDTYSGTAPEFTSSNGPFATLERAQQAVRAYAGKEPVTIYLREGTYIRTQTFHLTKADSGTQTAPIVYRPFQNETVRLIGGHILSHFTPVIDPAILNRLSETARKHIVQCDLKTHNISDFGRLTPRGYARPVCPSHLELFASGRRMQLSRYPNENFERIKAPAEFHAEGDGHGGTLGKLEAGFFIETDRPKSWQSIQNVWVHGYWAWDWSPSYDRMASYDPTTGHILTEEPHGLYGIKSGQRFYFLNILEELDAPSEYYVDTQTGMLYFYPPEDLSQSEMAASVLESPLIHIQDAEHITLQQLTLEYTRGHGILVQNGSHVHINGCTVRNIGNTGILVEAGHHHAIQSCDIYHLGDSGIEISGGNRHTLTRCEHTVINNHIHHIGEWVRAYCPAIRISGVGIRVAHNHLHHGPHNAILLTGNEHLIEYNHIHHVCLETGDVGAFYMGRDWTERGIRIQYNYFHHLGGYGMGSMGIYMDDCASGGIIIGNIFYHCTRAVFLGGGRNHRVENNIFVACKPAIHVDGRGLDQRPVWHNMVYQTMKQSFDAMHPLHPPYSIHYPELREVARYYQADTGVPPEGNLILRNISWKSDWIDIRHNVNPKMVALQNNFIDEDPHFINEAQADFRLQENSPVYEIGFKPIPVDKIGMYKDDFRLHQSD